MRVLMALNMNIDLKLKLDEWIRTNDFKIKGKHWKEVLRREELSKHATSSRAPGRSQRNHKKVL